METVSELIVPYLVTLKNAKIYSVHKADVSQYLTSIGIDRKKIESGINEAVRSKRLLPLKNGKLTLNPRNK